MSQKQAGGTVQSVDGRRTFRGRLQINNVESRFLQHETGELYQIVLEDSMMIALGDALGPYGGGDWGWNDAAVVVGSCVRERQALLIKDIQRIEVTRDEVTVCIDRR